MHALPRATLVLALLTGLGACQSPPDNAAPAPASRPQAVKDTLHFIDYSGFDQALSQALHQPEPVVTVLMQDKVSPNQTPERLQKWLQAVERHGGRVEVETPPNELRPRSPAAIISLLGSLWNAIKVAAEVRDRQLMQSVQGRDALISLERNAEGQVVISRIAFKKAP